MSRVGRRGRRIRVALAVLMVIAPAGARAVSPAAEALFEEGRRLMAAGQTAEACARFTESYALEASSGKLLNLALCHETQGKTATAWAEYRAAGRLARTEGRADRAAAADDKAAALVLKLARLTIVAAASVPGLKVASEQGALDEGGLGVAVPIDPGAHQVTVTAPGHVTWTATVEIKDGEQRTLEIPLLVAEPPPGEVSRPVPAIPMVAAVPASPPTPRRARFDLYLAVSGGALVVAGAALYGAAVWRFDAAKTACGGAGCSDRDSRVTTIEALEYSGFGCWVVGGGLLLASGLHYWFQRTKAPLAVSFDPHRNALLVGASF